MQASNRARALCPLTDAAPPGARRPFLGELAGLRFLAALWVVGFHALPRDDRSPAPWAAFWGAGHTGVTLFFVLSGFILVYTYGPVDGRPIDARRFFIARAARLFPVYLASLLIAVPEFLRTVMPPGGGRALPWTDVALAATTTPLMLQAWFPRSGCYWNCPAWSLSAEAFFYLLFPFFAALLYARRASTVLLATAGAWVLALGFALLRASPTAWPGSAGWFGSLAHSLTTPVFRLPEFLLGLAIGRWYLDRRMRGERLQPVAGLISALIAGCTIVAVAARSVPVPVDPVLAVLLLPLFALLILGLAERGNRGLLARPAAMMLGESSYALYLIHGPMHVYVLGAARRVVPGSLTANPWMVFWAYLLLVIGVSFLLYRHLERPARHALRMRFAPRPMVGGEGKQLN